jgi:hypothetical protein
MVQVLHKYLCGGGNSAKNAHLVTIYIFFAGKEQNFAKKVVFLGERWIFAFARA